MSNVSSINRARGSEKAARKSARQRHEVTPTADWGVIRKVLDVGVIVLCVGLALIPILPAYDSGGALGAIVAGLVCGALPIVLGARFRWPFVVTLAVTFLVYVVVGGAIAFSHELVGGIVPSGYSIGAMLTGIVTSWKEALTLEPPLGTAHGVLILPFLMAVLGAAIVTVLTMRKRTWWASILALSVPLALHVAAILWGTTQSVLPRTLGMALPLMLIVWAAWRMGIWRPGRMPAIVGLLLAALAATFIVAPATETDAQRTLLRATVVPPFDLEDQISPLSAYRSFIKDYADTPLLSVTGLPKGAAVRLATMDEFDGIVWDVSGDGNRRGSGAFRRIGNTVPQTRTGEPFTVDIRIEGLTGVWAPTVGYLDHVEFGSGWLSEDFRFNDATGAAVLPTGLRSKLRYTLSGVIPKQPTDEQLGQAGIGSIDIADATHIPDVVSERAAAISRDGATVPLVVRKFEDFLANGGYFSHGEQVDGYPSLSGHGASRIAELFSADQMIGDAEQYASAMALMARSQGIPSRVVMGFLPGEDAGHTVTLTGKDMQAWVEVFFDDYGWVSYYPTPDESRTPSKNEEEAKPQPEPEVVQTPPDPQPSVSPPAVDTEDTNVAADDENAPDSANWTGVIRTALAVGIPLAVLVLIPLLILAAKARRRLARKQAVGADKVLGGWSELLDAARDLGIRAPSELTRRETARYIEAGNPEAAVRPLADTADRAQFGYDPLPEQHGVDYWRDVERAISKLGARASRWRKLRARLSLATFSFWKRLRR